MLDVGNSVWNSDANLTHFNLNFQYNLASIPRNHLADTSKTQQLPDIQCEPDFSIYQSKLFVLSFVSIFDCIFRLSVNYLSLCYDHWLVMVFCSSWHRACSVVQ